MMATTVEASGGEFDVVYIAANMAHFASWFELPEAPEGYRWRICFNTGEQKSPILANEPTLASKGILLGERSVAILRASAAP